MTAFDYQYLISIGYFFAISLIVLGVGWVISKFTSAEKQTCY